VNTRLTFRQGLSDALPIFFGYLSVSVAFGILASARGIPVWLATAVSMTSLTGTGQFVWLDLVAATAALAQTALALAVINARYFLMSLSLSQKLPGTITLWQRLIIAFGNTDEIFAIAMTRDEPLNFRYMSGLIVCSYAGWVGGTAIGGLASGAIPASVLSALGIALYAMFIALVVPPAKKSRPALAVVLIAAAINCLLRFIPALGFITSGWAVIISGTTAAFIGALLFPECDCETAEAHTVPDRVAAEVK
jgi:Predicted branched-chain amino acid permease (azaleucine resistance)